MDRLNGHGLTGSGSEKTADVNKLLESLNAEKPMKAYDVISLAFGLLQASRLLAKTQNVELTRFYLALVIGCEMVTEGGKE